MNKVLLTEREKKLLIGLTGFLAVFTIFIYGIQPRYDEYQAKTSQVNSLKLKLEELEAFEEKLANEAFSTPAVESKVLELDKKIPNKAESAELVHYIRQAMADKGIMVEGISITESEEDSLKVYSVNIQSEGTYDQLMGFLGYLENFPRLAQIEKLNWAIDKTNSQAKIKGNFDVRIYSLDHQRPYLSNSLPYDKPEGRSQPFGDIAQ